MLKITATELPRILKCGGYVNLKCDKPEQKENKVRDEGNAAHWLVEQVAKNGMSVDELVDRQAPNGIFIDGEMVDYLAAYLKECEGAEIEKDVSFDIAGVHIACRVDAITYTDEGNTRVISDLKYGWRIVEPQENWTMLAYAIGSTMRSAVGETILKIFQPRPYHREGAIRSVVINEQELQDFYAELETKLTESLNNNQLNVGEHCYNCSKMHECPAAQKVGYNVIDLSGDVYADKLTDKALSINIDQLTQAAKHVDNLLTAYKDEAFSRIKKGYVVDNYFVEPGTSLLKWKKTVTPEFIKMMTGREDLTKESLITPLQAEKLGVDVNAFSERIAGSLKLVRQDANQRAAEIFKKL